MELRVFDDREQLLEIFKGVRDYTQHLCTPLTVEDMVVSTTTDTSPPKWHLAHTSWFFEKFILSHSRHYKQFNSNYNQIFNSYYLTLGDPLDKVRRSHLSRPTTQEIIRYRNYVDEHIEKYVMDNHCDWDTLKNLLILGINHEQQHQELLLMDIKQNFYLNPLKPIYHSRQDLDVFFEQVDSNWINFPEGLHIIGADHNDHHFSYDNERGSHKAWLNPFSISSHLVTNGEYLNFIMEGGYQRHEFWSSDGLKWIIENGVNHPLYWELKGDEYWVFDHYGLNPLDLEAPVAHVSFFEAQAYAKFMNARLPREEEWEVAAGNEFLTGHFLEEGLYRPRSSQSNFNIFSQIHGTLWEWTMSSYSPYPGYRALEGALGEYNEKFMNQQYVLRGGSCITPKNHYRTTYRNYYYPQLRWQFCGIRLAKDNI